MAKSDSGEKKVIKNKSNSHLIQVAVVCLAGVSLFTTAQGMTRYIFKNDAISYASSTAIQGILLAMSMGLPEYLQGVFKNQWNIFFKWLVSIVIVALTGVALFCSSWFSYIYIAEVVHFDSWDIESELLVQQTYRAELYDAKDYAHAYRVYLENSLGEKIIELDTMANELEQNEKYEFQDIEWETERARYAGMETLAGNYMLPVIDTMENAMQENSSQNSREQAARAIEDAENNINNRKEVVDQRLEDINANIDSYNTRIADYTNRINRATEGTDISSLQAALNNTTQLLQRETENQNTFLAEYDQLNEGLSQLQIYETYLGLNESTSSITIKSQLFDMQTEFFAENPDEEALLTTAEVIFKSLRSATNEKEKNEKEEQLAYMKLLVQMNQLTLNLKDYSSIKKIESQLEDYINKLATQDVGMATEGWKEFWRGRLDNLKSVISSMPVYVAETENNVENMTVSQREILQGYRRNDSSKRLDDMLRLYIAEHNALYQGLIYLWSPYNGLAWFALILAFSFDVSGFILGFVTQGDGKEDENIQDETLMDKISGNMKYRKNSSKVPWSILPTLHKYWILTGDYEKKDSVYSYQVFEDGLPENWKVSDTASYGYGIYKQDSSVETKGAQVPKTQKEILFRGQAGGPQDGVYLNCSLKFNEGSLLLVEEINNVKSSERFLVNLYEYVPVHSYSHSRGESRTIPVKDLTKSNFEAQMAVLALNDKGSRVAAIYVVED